MGEDSRGSAPVEKKMKKKKKAPLQEPAEVEPETRVEKVKKNKSGETHTAPAVAAASNTASEEAVASGKSKKRKRDKSAGNAGSSLATADEDERRGAQREIQQLVLRLRSEGKSKHEIEAAKFDLRKGLGKSLRKPDGARAKKTEAWKQRQNEEAEARVKKEGEARVKKATPETSTDEKVDLAAKKTTKDDAGEWRSGQIDPWKEARREGLEHKHDLVVIPVIWRGRHDHQEIEKAAADVKAFLAQQGLDVWVDSRRHYTPGQKFAHWEFRGVMLRIEIGPEDFNAGMLRLCRAKEAGDYKSVEKKRLRLPPRGSRKLLLQLKEWGFSQLDIERRAGDDEESDEEDASTGARGTAKAGAEDDDDIAGNWKPRVSAEEPKKKKKRRTA